MTKDENIGKVFGIYTIRNVYSNRYLDGHLLYECECNVCHKKVAKRLVDAKRHNKKCTHINSKWKNKRIGRVFLQMIDRCYNEECKDYRWYGEKGITVCDEWRNNPESFELWALQNGYCDTLTIDRIESSKNYSPDNCQWILREENSRKAGLVNWITIDDQTLTGRQWAEKLCIGTNIVNTAIRKYGLDKTKELIMAMIKESPSTKHRKSHQTWFDVYGIQV